MEHTVRRSLKSHLYLILPMWQKVFVEIRSIGYICCVLFLYIFISWRDFYALFLAHSRARVFSSVFLLPIINNITAKTESNIECVILKLVPNKNLFLPENRLSDVDIIQGE